MRTKHVRLVLLCWLLLASFFLIPQQAQAAEGTLRSDEYDTYYCYGAYDDWAEGRAYIDGKFYDCAKGWQQINGKWYYFDTEYGFAYKDDYREINGNSYYFGKDGAMQTGWIEQTHTFEDGETFTDWFYADPSGKLLGGWQYIGSNWYYFNPDYFYMRSDGIFKIDGSFYYFRPDGAMGTGWCVNEWTTDLGKTYQEWYYADPNGQLVKGWKNINGTWYYFDEDSDYAPYMYSGGAGHVNDTLYVFQDSGALVNSAGWVYAGGDWYYTKASGIPETGWKNIGGAWYYFIPEWGGMCTSAYEIEGTLYTFGEDGVMTGQITSPGWHKIGYDWYYIQEDGKAASGWTKIDNDWYFFLTDGHMARSGRWFLDDTDNIYFLQDSGALVSQEGWYAESGEWYYVGSDGILITGWKKVGNNWYYLESPYGAMVYDTSIEIDGEMYTFDSNGVWIK